MLKFSTNVLWLLLLAATGLTYWLGESGQVGQASMVPVFVIFVVSFFKGFWVINDFMELRHAPSLWRNLLVGWLGFVVSMILLAYWLGSR
ncbi:MAG: cytochrome C oxidase subunit IV family protein [Rhodoferax sp.]|uniref:cytochrome C oxidase subunit IV family protein n=1 Tax=Rhodoferax sp. TaxID=50421 RepID=UPI002629E8F9|nr:cytochrome C oxidase subunit IV family protein [Rhodoferax sp.]MDD2883011.1 cytochrome C oxidase subunit IV family protein [Rhodoferax sp.]